MADDRNQGGTAAVARVPSVSGGRPPRPAPPSPPAPPVSPAPPATTGSFAANPHVNISKVCPKCGTRYPSDFIVCPKDATQLEEADPNADPLVGTVLANTYQVLRVIGEGGMGKVYEARHLRLGSRQFAVKVLHGEFARHQDVLSRFQREAEAAAAIAHSHVVEVFDVSRTDDGRPFIVSEFLEGEDFHDYLERREKLDVPTAVAVARQVAAALKAAHEANIVHRDLKPENLFICAGRVIVGRGNAPFVKVLDFGISKVQGKDTNLTRTGMIMGTPNYMAPEQARGEKVDHRVDIYALGAIMYRMVTGKRAFDGTDPSAVITMVLAEEPKRPRAIEPSIPEAFEVVIQRAMAKDARDRFQSMEDLDRALAAFDISGTSMSIMPPGSGGVRIAPSSDSRADAHARTIGGDGISAAATAIVSPKVVERRRDLEQLEAAGRDARIARPTIIALTPVLVAWIFALVVGAASGVIRALRRQEITETETMLMVLFSAAAGITPLILWIVHVAKHVWKNSVRAIEIAGDMRRFLFGSWAAYGLVALVVRILYTVFLHHSPMLVSGWLDVAGFVVGVLGGAFAGGIGVFARLRRRLLNT